MVMCTSAYIIISYIIRIGKEKERKRKGHRIQKLIRTECRKSLQTYTQIIAQTHIYQSVSRDFFLSYAFIVCMLLYMWTSYCTMYTLKYYAAGGIYVCACMWTRVCCINNCFVFGGFSWNCARYELSVCVLPSAYMPHEKKHEWFKAVAKI